MLLPSSLRRCLGAALLASAGTSLAQQGGLDAGEQRRRLAAERASVETAFRREEAQCRARFVVTACLDEAKARRRKALEGLRQQEVVLQDAERKRRAADRMAAIQEKQRAADARPVPPPVTVKPRAPRASEPAASAALPAEPTAAGNARQRAASKEAYEHRQEQAARHREAVERRNAERAKKGPAAAPLPPPASRP